MLTKDKLERRKRTYTQELGNESRRHQLGMHRYKR